MASRSDSGNETRGSSESDNSPTPTPTKDLEHQQQQQEQEQQQQQQQHTRDAQSTRDLHQQPRPKALHVPSSGRGFLTPASASVPVPVPDPVPVPSTVATSRAPPGHRCTTARINPLTTPISRTTPAITPYTRTTIIIPSAPRVTLAPTIRTTPTATPSQRTTPTATPSQRITPTATPQRTTPTITSQRTTPVTRPSRLTPSSTRLTPTTHNQRPPPLRPLPRRPPSSGMGSAGSVHVGAPLGPLTSSRGRQRNSVAVVDSREHIYEELELCRGPPKLAPVSGVLPQGKVVIRPIAFKPVASPGVQGISPPTNCGVVGGGSSASFVAHSSGVSPAAKPDPRYTSAPTLARGVIHHYGSMGDLKTLSHNSYSLDRRGLTTPLSSRGHSDQHTSDNKYNSLTKLHNSKNTSLNNKNSYSNINNNNINNSHNTSTSSNGSSSSSNKSPSICPPALARPPSHQSTCSNIEDSHNHHKFAQDGRLSSHYESSLDNRLSSTYDNPTVYTRINGYSNSDLPRYDSLKNLSSDSGHSFGHHLHSQPMSNGLHQRMGGSVTNLSRISNVHHSGSVQGLDRPGSSIRLDRSASVTGSNLDRSGSVSGSNLGLDRSVSVTGSNLGLDRTICGSVSGSLSELTLDEHHQTPSPSDSGVAELEAMLKEKDSEINTLRETMEQNEQVIFKVYEEKEKTWERELKKIRDLYDSRLKGAQQKALKMEQSLTTQTYQLQQERRKLIAELEEVRRERDGQQSQTEQLRRELNSLRAQLEETEWSLCQKSGEISLLKTQLKDSQGDQTTRGHELLHLRAQVRQYQTEVERRRAEINSLHDLMAQQRRESEDMRLQLDQAQQQQSQARAHDQDLSLQMDKLKTEVEAMKKECELQRQQFEEERVRWIEEKERVIRYQKQLHQNYVAMFGRNRQLEEEVARLTGVPLPPLKSLSPPKFPAAYADIREPSGQQLPSESRC